MGPRLAVYHATGAELRSGEHGILKRIRNLSVGWTRRLEWSAQKHIMPEDVANVLRNAIPKPIEDVWHG